MKRWLAGVTVAAAAAAMAGGDDGAGSGERPVELIGPVHYTCGGDPADRLIVTFFRTDPPGLRAERGGGTAIMTLQRSASGAKYAGTGGTFWEHHGEATLTWGADTTVVRCVKAD